MAPSTPQPPAPIMPNVGFIAPAGAATACRMSATSPLAASLLVALGGGIGALLRYQFSHVTAWALGPQAAFAFPWATLLVNILGSLAMGLLAGWLARHGNAGIGAGFGTGEQARLFIGVGLLGGFTTFSAFSLDMILLVERGQPGLAIAYAAISVLGGLAALFIGLTAMRVQA